MTFEKKTWRDNPPSLATPITAAELNRLEDGVEKALDDTTISLTTEDLNDVIEPGTYLNPSNSSATLERNYPYRSAGYLEVVSNRTGSFVLQRYTSYKDEVIYFRTYQGSANVWNEWSEFLIGGVETITLGTENLNDITETGYYTQGRTANTDGNNYPRRSNAILEVVSRGGGSFTIQRLTTAYGDVYRRFLWSGEWSEWEMDIRPPQLRQELDSKAPANHTHQVSEIPGLVEAIENNANVGYIEERLEDIESAYDVALQEGFDGGRDEWLESLRGEEGPEGPYGGTEVVLPQLLSYLESGELKQALDTKYRRGTSVLDHGLIGDGQTDNTQAFKDLLQNASPGVIYFPAGHYLFYDDFNIPNGVSLVGEDSKSVLLDWSKKDEWTNTGRRAFLMWEDGVIAHERELVEPVQKGAPSVEVSLGHQFQKGDFIRITSDEILFGEAVKAEFHRITEVDGGVLHLSSSTFDSYDPEMNGIVEKIEFTTGSAKGFTVKGKGVTPGGYADGVSSTEFGDNAIRAGFAKNFQTHDLVFLDVEGRTIRLDSVFYSQVTNCEFEFSEERVRLQYGVSISGSSQMVSVRGCVSYNCRHMVTTSTSRSTASSYKVARGIPRVINIVANHSLGSWQNPIDTHRGGEYITITGNTLTTESVAVKARGTHIVITGNVFIGKTSNNYSLNHSGVRINQRCQDIHVADNIFKHFENGVLVHMLEEEVNEITVVNNSMLDCLSAVAVTANAHDVVGLRILGNTMRSLEAGNPIELSGNYHGLEIKDNSIISGTIGISARNTTIDNSIIGGNKFRGQLESAASLNHVANSMVIDNFAPNKPFVINGGSEGSLFDRNLTDIQGVT